MLTRAALIIAILASITVCGLSLTKIRERTMRLQGDLATQTKARLDTEAQLASVKAGVAKSEASLQKTRTELKVITARYEDALDKLRVKDQQLEDTKQELVTVREVSDVVLRAEVKKSANEAKRLREEINGLTAENGILSKKLNRLVNVPDTISDPDWKVPDVSTDFKAKVVTFDPKWQFVVINAGENQEALPYAELLVTRRGELVAKLRIKTVQRDTCVANILPGWGSGNITEGDTVIPLRSGL